ncbi:hypothetical protein GBAR_LOCUS7596 [Geodia barretti]|uniref:Uncharacterized protein n=1 Tax=Geodia barretti TaxID=519541 RepID=A0AA35RKA6_GEOBA|nr:hypothetical protein GBAR_LOCUS7596 [Geodia barretti]
MGMVHRIFGDAPNVGTAAQVTLRAGLAQAFVLVVRVG